MLRVKNILLNTLGDFGFKVKEKKNYVLFTDNIENYVAKVFFHENTMDFVLTYKSSLTDSGNRNFVIKDITNAQELYDMFEDIVSGVEMSNAVTNNFGKRLEEVVSTDTYNRYVACRKLLPIVNTLSFVA